MDLCPTGPILRGRQHREWGIESKRITCLLELSLVALKCVMADFIYLLFLCRSDRGAHLRGYAEGVLHWNVAIDSADTQSLDISSQMPALLTSSISPFFSSAAASPALSSIAETL